MKSVVKCLARSEALANLILSMVFLALKITLDRTANRFPFFRERLKEKNLVVQMKLKDNSRGRYYAMKDGAITSGSGIHESPDVTIVFGSAATALEMLVPPRDQLSLVNAMKNFQLGLEGPEELTSWWMETMSLMQSAGTVYGTDVGKGVTRYTSNTNGGPVFVYVREGKILRITPIDFDDKDAPSVDDPCAGQDLHAPPENDHIALHACLQVDDLFARPLALPDETGRL